MRTEQYSEIAKRTGTFESFDGTPIYYEVRGEGRPIVLCYGIACLINHWTHQLRYFANGYQTIVFDYRGHHSTPTPKDRHNISITAICRDIHGLLHHLGIQKASFWGHSFGVQVLLRYFELFAPTVSNLVFINGFARNPLPGIMGVDAIKPIFKVFKEGYKANPSLVSRLWRASVSSPFAIPISSLAGGFNLSLTSMKNIEVYSRGVATIDLDVFISLFEKMLSYDGTPTLSKIHAPALIVSGEKDGVTPKAQQYELHDLIRGSQFLSVPYGSHCTQLDMPDYVNLRVEKFLAEIGYLPTEPRSLEKLVSAPKRKKKKPWEAGSL